MKSNILDKIKKGSLWFFKSYIWIFLILFAIDLISKQVIVAYLGGWDTIYQNGHLAVTWNQPFIPNFMSFTIVLNDGAAWGMFGNIDNEILRRTILIGVSAILSAVFLGCYIWKFKKLNGVYRGLLMGLIAGALGNFVDRAFYPDGLVVDFIKFDFMNFPVFNIADAVLVVTLIVMIVYMIVVEIKAYLVKKKANEGSTSTESLNEQIEEKPVEEKPEEKPEENKNSEELQGNSNENNENNQD